MINTLLIIYVLIVLAGILFVGIYTIVQLLQAKRIRRLEKALSQRYMRIVTAIMISNENSPSRFPRIEFSYSKEILAKVLATVSLSVYSPDSTLLGRIATENGIDKWLLRKIHHSRGFKRAYYISLLATQPLPSSIVAQTARYYNDRNRLVRFYSLIIQIVNDPSSALRALTEFGERLNDYEIAEIMTLLRRGILPVACEPLLVSQNYNLRILGINIAREFSIEQTRPLLLNIIATERNSELAQAAIYALVAMRSSLANHHIAASVRSMSNHERQTLCRHLVLEGYSPTALKHLFGVREGLYAQHLASTYKRRIVCTPQT